MQKTSSKLLVLTVLALSLTLATSMVVAKNDGNKDKGEKSKSSNSKDIKGFEKATPLKSNAQLHKEKVKEVVQSVEALVGEKNKAGDEEVGQELDAIVENQEQQAEETADQIEAVETQNKFKKMLVGTDYKNLGQLRSSLVHNRNDIRKLTKLIGQTEDPILKAELQTQLTVMTQERERIKTVITDNESGFSILGWVTKFLTGYDSTPLETPEEEDLTQEVEEALAETSETGSVPETSVQQ